MATLMTENLQIVYDWLISYLSSVSFLNKLTAFTLLICLILNLRNIYSNFVLRLALREVKTLPKRLADLPEPQTSLEEYSRCRRRIEEFVANVSEGQPSELRLTSDNINNLSLKGVPVNKHKVDPALYMNLFMPIHPSEYFYFEVQEAGVLQTEVKYPSLLDGKDGVYTETKLLSFFKEDGCLKTGRETILLNERDAKWFSKKFPCIASLLDTYISLPLCCSTLLFHLFGVLPLPDRSPDWYKDEDNYQPVLDVVNKIYDIEIIDQTLVIKAG